MQKKRADPAYRRAENEAKKAQYYANHDIEKQKKRAQKRKEAALKRSQPLLKRGRKSKN